VKTQNTTPLRLALLGNGIFSALSALILIMVPGKVGLFIGVSNPLLLVGIGIGLGIFSADLFHQATRQRMQTWRALYSSFGDALWVVGTAILLTWFSHVISEPGGNLLIVVAVIVALFGCLQFWGAGEAHRLKNTRLYRHCISVRVPVGSASIWKEVSDLAGISKHFPSLQSSFIRDGGEARVGAIRQCQDHNGKVWAEKCTGFEIGKRLELKFLCDEEGFPYPASEMVGGWELVEVSDNETDVQIWWELRPKPPVLAPLILPLLGLKADIDFPPIVYRMANSEGVPGKATSVLGRILRPSPSC